MSSMSAAATLADDVYRLKWQSLKCDIPSAEPGGHEYVRFIYGVIITSCQNRSFLEKEYIPALSEVGVIRRPHP